MASGPVSSSMNSFKHKPSFDSRAWDWLLLGPLARERAASRFVRQLSAYLDDCLLEHRTGPTLLPLREAFRKIFAVDPGPGIAEGLQDANPLVRSTIIWILSRSQRHCVLPLVEDLADDPSPLVRKHVARALRRLEAWTALKWMSSRHPDDRAVQWFAKRPPIRVSFQERLAHYASRVDNSRAPLAAGPSRMKVWRCQQHWSGQPPKSPDWIRTILLRIQRCIRGET